MAKPFNDVFEVNFPRGPEPLLDTPFIRGRKQANMWAAHFRS